MGLQMDIPGPRFNSIQLQNLGSCVRIFVLLHDFFAEIPHVLRVEINLKCAWPHIKLENFLEPVVDSFLVVCGVPRPNEM